MHRCLYLSDITDIICAFLSPSSLQSFARACKALSEPALNALYADIDSPLSLLRCLPEDLLDYQERSYDDVNCMGLRREPTERDWAIFKRYARRVRTLSYSTATRSTEFIYSSVFHAFSPSDKRPLLPSLHVLRWDCNAMMDFREVSFILAMLGPSVVEISLANAFRAGPSLMLALPSSAPSLEKLSLCVDSLDGPYYDSGALNGVLPQFGRLTHFTLVYSDVTRTSPPPSIVDLAASLPSLESLTLMPVPQLNHEARAGGIRLSRTAPMFPMLRRLSISGTAENSLTFLSHTLSFPSVSSITALITKIHDPLSLLKSFASFFSPSTLSNVHLIISVPEEDPECPLVYIGDALRPFTRFSRLESLDLYQYGMIHLCDADIATLAPAWSRLRVFRTSCALRQPTVPDGLPEEGRLTFKGLETLLRCCPRLQQVEASLDACVKPPDGFFDETRNMPSNYSITQLDLTDSPAEDTQTVARVLKRLLPRLVRIQDDGDGDSQDVWKEIEELLIANIRSKEILG